MNAATDVDMAPDGRRTTDILKNTSKDKQNHIWAYSPLDGVQRHMAATGYPAIRFRFMHGKVGDSIPEVLPNKIALLRLDTDWHECTLHEVIHLYSLLVPGCVLILKDFGFWQVARKAVYLFFSRLADPPRLHTICDGVDDSARWCKKSR